LGFAEAFAANACGCISSNPIIAPAIAFTQMPLRIGPPTGIGNSLTRVAGEPLLSEDSLAAIDGNGDPCQ
jgi:hypothetical protein